MDMIGANLDDLKGLLSGQLNLDTDTLMGVSHTSLTSAQRALV